MEMPGYVWVVLADGQKLLGQVARFQAGQPNAPQSLQAGNTRQERRQSGGFVLWPATTKGSSAAEGAEKHTGQNDFLMSGLDEPTTFRRDVIEVFGSQPAAGVGHDAIGTEGVTAVLYL